MKSFAHFNASSIEETVSLLDRYQGRAYVVAGGTDLLGKMKDRILPDYPEALIDLKTIVGLDEIKTEETGLRLGPLAILEDIAQHSEIRMDYAALAEAARRTASPHLREMGTIGGNICQDIRCWYYRNPENRFPCLRKGGGRCYALQGDTRYHSIFGGVVREGCIAVHPSDTAPALVALNAKIKTSKRTLPAEDFFQVDVKRTTILDTDEIVVEIQIPKPPVFTKSAFLKFALRKSIDFPIVNCAAMIEAPDGKINNARICLNGVYVKPYRAEQAEEAIRGMVLDETTAEAAALKATADASPRSDNRYMVEIAKSLVAEAVLGCR